MAKVEVGYRGQIVEFDVFGLNGDVLEKCFVVLDEFLASHCAAILPPERRGDYDLDCWDVIASSVARGKGVIHFAAKPEGGRTAATVSDRGVTILG